MRLYVNGCKTDERAFASITHGSPGRHPRKPTQAENGVLLTSRVGRGRIPCVNRLSRGKSALLSSVRWNGCKILNGRDTCVTMPSISVGLPFRSPKPYSQSMAKSSIHHHKKMYVMLMVY